MRRSFESGPRAGGKFENHFGKLRQLAGFVAPDRLLAMALDECGYAASLPDRARANVEKLLAYLRRRVCERPRPLAELLEDLEVAAGDAIGSGSAAARGWRRGAHHDDSRGEGARVSGGVRERAASRTGSSASR